MVGVLFLPGCPRTPTPPPELPLLAHGGQTRTVESKPSRWVTASVLAVLLGTSLVACSDTRYGLPRGEAVGTWRSGDTRLELADDGTFEATAWPSDVQCSLGDDPYADDPIDFSGTWMVDNEGTNRDLVLHPGDGACETSRITSDVRSDDGLARLCVHARGSLSGPAENFFTLYQGDPPETEDPDRCLNY